MTATSTPVLKGRRVFLYFSLFFGVIILVNAGLVTMAVRTHTGTVTDHPYEKGLAYNEVVTAEAAQEKLGWKGTIVLTGSTLHFTLHDAKGTLLKPTEATAHLSRPTQAKTDATVPLVNGSADIAFPASGVWDVRVFATVGNNHYQQTQRIIAP